MKYEVLSFENSIARVKHTPNFIEKLFGYKEKTVEYIDMGVSYLVGGTKWYLKETGEVYGHAGLIDKFVMKQRIEKQINQQKNLNQVQMK